MVQFLFLYTCPVYFFSPLIAVQFAILVFRLPVLENYFIREDNLHYMYLAKLHISFWIKIIT